MNYTGEKTVTTKSFEDLRINDYEENAIMKLSLNGANSQQKVILISLPSHPCSKTFRYSRKVANTPDLFRPRRVLMRSSAQRLALCPGVTLGPCWMGSGEAAIPSGAAGWPLCMLPSHDGSQPL